MSKSNPERASLAAAIIAHDAAARAAQKSADACAAGARLVAKAETALLEAKADLEAARTQAADKLAFALAEGGDIAPHEAQDTVRARTRVTDAEDNLSALQAALERLGSDAANAEYAFQRARKARDSAIKRVVGLCDIEGLIARASAHRQGLEDVHQTLRYISRYLVADNSDTYRRLWDYLLGVIFQPENLEESDPAIAAMAAEEIAAPGDLQERVRAYLTEHPASSWDEAVAALAALDDVDGE